MPRLLPPEPLEPNLDLLREEYVLVQAWKKTAAYIRAHNWFSDPLDLDLTSIDLENFLGQLRDELKSPEDWSADPLWLVPAPKSQEWWVQPEPGRKTWRPRPPHKRVGTAGTWMGPEFSLRPLAHVSLRDQVVATALMLCIADRVETEQGNPAIPLDIPEQRSVTSYGHRLLCDPGTTSLRHRWGSTKLYRGYFTDYRTFIRRSSVIAQHCKHQEPSQRVFIVYCDLSRFYDRVRPHFLTQSLARLRQPGDDDSFYALAKRVLCWRWRHQDVRTAERYARIAGIGDYSRIALPQGLASAGFWANIALLKLDERLQECYATGIKGLRVDDVSRYVDDIRIVVSTNEDEPTVKRTVRTWLKRVLQEVAPDLRLNDNKMDIFEHGGGERALVGQSHQMNRIQARVSGGFTTGEGAELLEIVENLLSLKRGFTRKEDESQWEYAPKPDVPDATAARFAATRFLRVAREIRPLLPDAGSLEPADGTGPDARPRTRQALDDATRAFALRLVEMWVHDPSNVRVLLTGFDLWPNAELLQGVLRLLREWTEKPVQRSASAQVAWYCLAEILRAGATRTGLRYSGDSLPSGTDLDAYRRLLANEARALLKHGSADLPWYLKQQASLFLIGHPTDEDEPAQFPTDDLPPHYAEILKVLHGEAHALPAARYAQHAVLLHRCFPERRGVALMQTLSNQTSLPTIATLDQALATEILHSLAPVQRNAQSSSLSKRLALDLSRFRDDSLACLVMKRQLRRDETTILRFTVELLKQLEAAPVEGPLPPWRVLVQRDPNGGPGNDDEPTIRRVLVRKSPRIRAHAQFEPPDWCQEPWRFQVGYLLRFALTRSVDHTRNVSEPQNPAAAPFYRSAASHWLQRKYGSFNAQGAFGGDWLPISDWLERFLSALLSWPGRVMDAHTRKVDGGIPETRRHIESRLAELEATTGAATKTQFLSMTASSKPIEEKTTLRICVAQSVFPRKRHIGTQDLNHPSYRARHTNHLQEVLRSVRSALDLRATHREKEPEEEGPLLDWLILPELAVHPEDLRNCLLPFARQSGALVLAGVTYEELPEANGLVNTAVWLIPQGSSTGRPEILQRRQGKEHLMAGERGLVIDGRPVKPYRPCQWVITLPYADGDGDGLRLSASVCFDATDLAITSDLRDRVDVYAIPALNMDVNTFDNLSVALNYHMFQMVIVANNGEFGGSSVYFPHRESYRRRVLHLHGGEQATIAFFEIPNVKKYLKERELSAVPTAEEPEKPKPAWKSPPAGYQGRTPD